jgi:hypothetical protein
MSFMLSGASAAGVFMLLLFIMIVMFILIVIVKYAIDSSRTSKKIDILTDELRAMRREIRASKNIIDKKI